MSDVMHPVSFGTLMNHILTEYSMHHRIYNVEALHYTEHEQALPLFGKELENPLGPAAGPHTQLAQNLVAAYVGGARFLEVKTIQEMYGDDLGIPRPCIYSSDEAYNVEWSAEFRCDKAAEEYIKAWFAIHLIAKEFGFGHPDRFMFIMSVGYNLKGIQSPLVDQYMETMKHGRTSPIWAECEGWALANLHRFEHVDEAYVRSMDDEICQAITLSTMHGCPAHEIESICTYLLVDKGLHMYLKCNPTLLGYDKVRELLDTAGFDYITFDPHQFEVDMAYDDAVPMIKRLQQVGRDHGRIFGVKLTNTFPVLIHNQELPGEQMYLSGKALLPLTISVAALLAKACPDLPISYSGGAERRNIGAIFKTGIWPVTVCTILLQGAGYNAMAPLAKEVEKVDYSQVLGLQVEEIESLSHQICANQAFHKSDVMKKKRSAQPSFPSQHSSRYQCKATCGTCVRTCPNRANELVHLGAEKVIVHIDEACNECGNCACHCIEPCQPYRDKLTYFKDKSTFEDSHNDGFYISGEQCGFRFKDACGEDSLEGLPIELKGVVEAFIQEHPYYRT